MDWSDEPWVKLYRRDTADWLLLSWQARGIFCLLLRVVSRAGTLDLGKSGAKAVAIHLRATWGEIEGPLGELMADGCVTIRDGVLTVPNFLVAQEATQSDRARARSHRERVRDLAVGGGSVTIRDEGITNRDETVTRGHAASRAVTPRHEEKRREEKRRDESPPTPQAGGAARASCSTEERVSPHPSAGEILFACSLGATAAHEVELARALTDLAVRGRPVTEATAKRLPVHLREHLRPGKDGAPFRPGLAALRGRDGSWTLMLSILGEIDGCARCGANGPPRRERSEAELRALSPFADLKERLDARDAGR